MNWLNLHNDHCSKLAKKYFWNYTYWWLESSWIKPIPECLGQVSKVLKALNCGVGGDRIQHVLWRALNLPVSSNLRNVVVLCGTNNLLLDSPKDIADGILEIARSFKTNYSCVNVIICGILPRDDSWSVNPVYIKKVNQILKFKALRIILNIS